MDTVVSAVLPGLTPAGRVPNVSFTDSSSSSLSLSEAALKVMLFSVSPPLKVTPAGTPL